MASFVFTADPTQYDLDRKAVPGLEVDWTITEYYADDKTRIRRDDTVYFFRKKGRRPGDPRFYGWGRVTVDGPVPASAKATKLGKRAVRPHLVRVRYMAVAETPISSEQVADDPDAATIRPIQGTATRIDDKQAAGLDRVLDRADVNTPGDGPQDMARRRMTSGDAIRLSRTDLDILGALWGFNEWLLPDETFGTQALWGSETVLAAMLARSTTGSGSAAKYLTPEPAESKDVKKSGGGKSGAWLEGFSRPPAGDLAAVAGGDTSGHLSRLSEDLIEFLNWAYEISDVAMGGEWDELAFVAALLTPVHGEQEHCALHLLRRSGVDLAASRRRLFEDTRKMFISPETGEADGSMGGGAKK